MKSKDKKAIHSKTVPELLVLLRQKREELVKSRLELRMNKVKNVHKVLSLRKEIAIMETIKREKEFLDE